MNINAISSLRFTVQVGFLARRDDLFASWQTLFLKTIQQEIEVS